MINVPFINLFWAASESIYIFILFQILGESKPCKVTTSSLRQCVLKLQEMLPRANFPKLSKLQGFTRTEAPKRIHGALICLLTLYSGFCGEIYLENASYYIYPSPGESWCTLAHWGSWKERKCDHRTSLCAMPWELVSHGENCPSSLGTNCWSFFCFYTD